MTYNNSLKYVWIIDSWPLCSFSSVHFSCSVVSEVISDPMKRSTPGLPVHHQLLEFTQTHVHRVGVAIQLSHPLSSPSPPAPSLLSLLPSLLGHHRALSWAPCPAQQLATSYLFYTWWCIYVSSTLPVCPPFPSLQCPLVHSLHLCLYSCPANRLVCTIFLDSISVH